MTITKVRPSRRATCALSKATLNCAAALATAAGLGLVNGASARAEHIPYEIATLGFTDTAHTPETGNRVVSIVDMNAVGQVVGNQTRFDTSNPNGRSAWFYGSAGLTRIGMFDDQNQSDHTSIENVQISTVLQLNDLGYAAGTANRYGGGATPNGQSVWVYFNGTNTRIGLFEDAHTTQGGIQVSSLVKLNALGQVAGNSERYDDQGDSWGYSAFIDDGTGNPTRIGLDVDTGSANEHRRAEDGQEFSNVQFLNDLGDAAGFSNRYAATGLTAIGQSAWVRTADGTTAKVGFVDAEHTRNATNGTGSTDLRRVSTVVALNNNSEAVGHSTRFNLETGVGEGQTAWLQRPSEAPVRLGFTDTVHTQGNGSVGIKQSTVQKLNDEGYATGISTRFNGSTSAGQSAWLYGPSGGPERVGLTDDEHTGANAAAQTSTAVLLNGVGHVAGTSSRFTDTNAVGGNSAWRHTAGSSESIRIGLFDEDHTRDDDFQNSSVVDMNETGVVVGHSTRYREGQMANWGQSAWISDGVNNTRIGLFDFAHTRSPGTDDFQSTSVDFVNADGHAVGTSLRFNGNATQVGQSGWYFDGTESIELVFSTNASTFETFTDISFLTDDGIALGLYTKYNGGVVEGNRAFLWDYNELPEDRFHDLGEFVEGGLSAAGWSALTSALEMSSLGHIRGLGTLTTAGGGGDMPYLLTPVPEPTALALLAMTGLAMLPRRRRP